MLALNAEVKPRCLQIYPGCGAPLVGDFFRLIGVVGSLSAEDLMQRPSRPGDGGLVVAIRKDAAQRRLVTASYTRKAIRPELGAYPEVRHRREGLRQKRNVWGLAHWEQRVTQ
jgi:hypothetical protein